MAWQPVRRPARAPNESTKNAISRGVMLVAGAALLFAAYKCFGVALVFGEDVVMQAGTSVRRLDRGLDIVLLPALAGLGLLLLGGFLVVAAVVPSGWLDRFVSPPADAEEQAERWTRFFWRPWWWPW